MVQSELENDVGAVGQANTQPRPTDTGTHRGGASCPIAPGSSASTPNAPSGCP